MTDIERQSEHHGHGERSQGEAGVCDEEKAQREVAALKERLLLGTVQNSKDELNRERHSSIPDKTQKSMPYTHSNFRARTVLCRA